MAAADPYKTLGVERSASPEAIKKAYRSLARKYHPDNNAGDTKAEERFKEIQGAYDILSDPEKKAAFDRGGFQMPGGQSVPFDMSDLSDLLGSFLGGRGRGGGPGRGTPASAPGRDLETQARITFQQSIDGTEVSLPVPSQDPCPDCRGTGGRPGSSMTMCPECSGQGVVMQSDGLFTSQTPCPKCRGVGRVPRDMCLTCRGTGRRPGGSNLRVKVPAGIRDGGRIKVAGRGEPGIGNGPRGDLYVVVHVAPSRVFQRKGDHLEIELPITVVEALRGGEVRVPTLDGTKTLRLAAGTKHGTVQRLKELGPPKTGGGRGDLHYRIAIELPKSLTDEQRAAVDALDVALGQEDPRAELLKRAESMRGAPSV
ncbi:MAG: DnaJ C-terminal domain-containing protein [Solirubrobacteraceae bacterium]|nr:DnaJ C-terminal domain-containing protein [Patulibacter sp.]